MSTKKTMIRALRCLAIAVEKDVQKDVAEKVKAYTDKLEADLKDAAFMLLAAEIITISRAAEMMDCKVASVREMLIRRNSTDNTPNKGG